MFDYSMISTPEALAESVEQHTGARLLCMDTEFVREKTYFPDLCLIQLRSEKGAACIDTVAVDDLSPLQPILNDPAALCVLHSCRQDLEAFDTRFSQSLYNLYDTQLAAAFCGSGDQVSYAALVESVCDKVLPKSHTRTDWRKRPLSDGQLEYAMDDVNYLPAIYEYMMQKLESMGRTGWHQLECETILNEADFVTDEQTVEQAWRRLKGGGRLPLTAQPVAHALSIWREKIAIQRNRPREWILPGAGILQLSQRKPKSKSAMASIDTIPSGIVHHSGDEILTVIESARDKQFDEPLWLDVDALSPEQRKLGKTLMKELSRISTEENISQSLLANRNEVEKLVRGRTDLKMLQGWRRELFGELLQSMVS